MVDFSEGNQRVVFRGNMPHTGELSIVLHDRFGKELVRLTRPNQSQGRYELPWDGTDSEGADVAPGHYNALIKEGAQTRDLKVIVIR